MSPSVTVRAPIRARAAVGGICFDCGQVRLCDAAAPLGSDGSLTGYAGGLQRKSALLRLEGIV